MATTDEISDYVSIDGVYLKKDSLVKMARCTGNPVVAEHYLFALAYHAMKHKRQDISDEVDEIRKSYNFAPFHTANRPTSSGKYDPDFNTMARPDVRARAVYKKLNKESKKQVLRAALIELRIENERLFKNKSCWIGIYFVVKDRLDSTLSKDYFANNANSITPADWPEDLKIGSTPFSNLSRKVNNNDRVLPYYEMANNPWDELCEKYWMLVLAELLTKE